MGFGVVGLKIKETTGGCSFFLKVVPRSSRNQIMGVENGELKIKIMAPPVEGAANEAVVEFVARCLKISKSSLFVAKGERSRHKVIQVLEMGSRELLEKLKKQN